MVRWGGERGILGALWLPVLREPCLMPGLCVSFVGAGTLDFSGLERDLERSRGGPAPPPVGLPVYPLNPQVA